MNPRPWLPTARSCPRRVVCRCRVCASVKRYARVKLVAEDVHGQPFEITAGGLVARAIQHEMDHLDGILFIDRLSSLKRQLIKRQLESIAAEGTAG